MDQAIRCPLHRKEFVLTSCISSQCQRQPLVCSLCPDVHQDHSSSLVTIQEYIQKVSKAVAEGNRQQKLIKEISSIDSVLKWCEDDEMHLRKVEEHCKAQKALITEDINVIRELFNDKCIQTQILLDQELEDFLQKYKEQFKICKSIFDESFTLFRQCNPYANPNNLIMKLQQSTTKEAAEFTNQLRRLLRREGDSIEVIRVSSERITEMTYNLPVYQFQEGIDNLCNQMSEILTTHLKSKLNISKPKQQQQQQRPVSPLKYVSRNLHKQYSLPQENAVIGVQSKSPRQNYQSTQPQYTISAHHKSLFGSFSDINLKPLKKYQLDFTVSSVEVVSQSLFAMTCSQDPHLRIFDTQQKRIHTLSAHQTPIIQMQKALEQTAALQPTNSVKQQVYLFTLSSDSVIVWTFESNSMIPHIFHKYPINNQITQICYLQDNQCLVLGDREGCIEVYNFQSQKIQQASMRGKHSKQISSISVLKRCEKFIVGAYDQSISVWRMLYSGSFENAYCESIIQCGNSLGSIQTMSLLIQNPNLIVVGTLEGSLKIVNLVSQCVVMESDSNKNGQQICDMLVVEDAKRDQFVIMSLVQSNKSLRTWKLQHNENGWSQNEYKIDVALQQSDNMMRSKLQLVIMPSNSQNPLVLIANEANKELLVYELISKLN